MSKKKINIAVIGATGYTGLDLVFLLSKHPNANIINLCATKNLGRNISFFDQRIKKKLPKISSINKIEWEKIDLIFFSLPNGGAQKIIKTVPIIHPKEISELKKSNSVPQNHPKDISELNNIKHSTNN